MHYLVDPLSSKGKNGGALRSSFMRGLFVVIPVAVTVWLLEYAVGLTNHWFGPLVRLVTDSLLPTTITSRPWFGDLTAVLSFLLLLVVLIVLGLVASFHIGKKGLRLIDHLFIHIPGVNSIYRSVRKMVDAFGNSDAQSFKRCVYLYFPSEYPSLGFVTKEVIEEGTNHKLLMVFIPQGPSPASGFIQIVAEDATWDAGISPEDGFKMIMSVGVLAPDRLPQAKPQKLALVLEQTAASFLPEDAVEKNSGTAKMTTVQDVQNQPALLPRRLRLTPEQVLGPYFIADSPLQSKLFPATAVGDQVKISGQVMAQDGAPLAGATVSVWVADPQGRYDNQDDDGNPRPITAQEQVYRGRLIADKSGRYSFDCLRPGNYFDGGWNLWRPAHIHVKVEAVGYKDLTTQLYFDDDAQNAHDIPGDHFFLPELAVQLSPAVPTSGSTQIGIFNFVLAKAS